VSTVLLSADAVAVNSFFTDCCVLLAYLRRRYDMSQSEVLGPVFPQQINLPLI